MEALTAVVLLVGRYGVQELVGALTGKAELGRLASELFGALAESENRISDRLAQVEQRLSGIEDRLDEVLGQRYQAALNAGMRSLLDAAAEVDPQRRAEEFAIARGRFQEATAAARSLLETAVAERYLMLCAIALGRPMAAKVAWDRINGQVTTAAIDLGNAFRNAISASEMRLEERGEAPPQPNLRRPPDKDRKHNRYQERLDAEAARIRADIADAAPLVERLLTEAGVLGQAIGQPPPAQIRLRITDADATKTPPQRAVSWRGSEWPSPGQSRPITFPSFTWVVAPTAASTRFGALIATWKRFEILADDEARPGTLSYLQEPPYRPTTHIRNARVDITVEADPALPRPLSIWQPGASGARVGRRSDERPRRHKLASGDRRYELSEVVAVPVDEHGNATGADAVCVDNVVLVRYSESSASGS
ncbi:hypothetical protein ACFQ1L_09310 [Phytohabitans flavus]|nr:hypothetical protein [Phytohabitans flavus]